MEYTPVRVSTLRGDQEIGFDLFVQLPNKYIHFARIGSKFDIERIKRLKKKKVRKLYIPADQESSYQNYVSSNLDSAFDNNSKAPVESRAQVAQGATQASVEEVFENPADEEVYNNAKDLSKKYANFLIEQTGSLKAVMDIENIDKDLAHHCTTVASLAVNVAKELGTTDTKQLELLTLGASLHDFGHFHGKCDWQKPIEKMSPEEFEEYKKHPRVGAEFLKDKKHLDSAVIAIIMEHEELGNGKGFPQGLDEKKIDKMAHIVGLCNFYDRLVTFNGMTREEAFKHLAFEAVGKYPLENINILKKVLKTI